MASVRTGYRRLYDSMGCSVVNQQPLRLVLPFGNDLEVEIYMGNKPRFGIFVETGHEDYLIPGVQTTLGQYTYHADATQSAYPRTFFTEIVCSQVLQVTDEVFEAFNRSDQAAGQELLTTARARSDEYNMVLDLLSGVIGLRFHPQFILKLLNENAVAFHNDQHFRENAGSSVQVLEDICLLEAGITTMHELFPSIGKASGKVVQTGSRVLHWLIRAWAERDIISKFNALFIPLEMVLEGVQGELPEDQRRQVEKLQTLIETYGGEDEEKAGLRALLGRLVKSQRPSLIDRFNLFAEQAKLPGWKNDIQAFKKFNRIRNNLLHRGDPNIRIHVSVGEEEMLALEDLTERYVNYFLFHDTVVYQSRFLPRPKTLAE